LIGSGFIGVIASFALTFGLLALVIFLLKRFQAGTSTGSSGIALQVLKRIPVGPKQGVALIRVADRVLVVSVGEKGSRLLTELTDEERSAALEPADSDHQTRAGLRARIPILGRLVLVLALLLVPVAVLAQADSSPATTQAVAGGTMTAAQFPPQMDIQIGEGESGLHLSGAVGLVVFMGLLSLLPALLLLMTSFTRILIVLQFLRPALGTQTSPPTQLLVAVAILLTGVVMHPVLQETNDSALQPYFNGEVTQAEAYKLGIGPFREFMFANTRDKDLALFIELSGASEALSVDEIPTVTIVSAFVTSELRTAFQMGFAIFLPFVVLDVIIASILMSLGMFMLPPMMVSLPFKLLLFVLADGWTLMVQNLAASFRF